MGDNDKPESGSGIHDDMIKSTRDKIDQKAKDLEKQKDTGGKGKGKK